MKFVDLAALFLVGALWGASFLFIRVASPVLGPVVLADARALVAGGLLLAYAVLMRKRLALRARLGAFLLLGAGNSAVPFVLKSTAGLWLPSSILATLNGAIPLCTAVVTAVWLGERLTPRKLTGLLLGVIGVATLVGWSPIGASGRVVLGVVCSLLASFCYAAGTVYARRSFAGASPLELTVGQLLAAGVLLLPLAVPTARTTSPDGGTLLATLGLALPSTAVAYLLYFRLNERVGPTKTSTVAFLVPGFGLLWGALLLDEAIGIGTLVGLGMILASVVLVTGMRVGARMPLPAPRAVGRVP